MQRSVALTSLWESVVGWYQGSFLSELIRYLSERYFSVEFGSYEHFSVSSGLGMTVRTLILALSLGVVLAALLTAYTRVTLGGFVRTLLACGCTEPSAAKTLYELGYFRSPSVRRELKRGAILRMVVRTANDTDGAGKPVPVNLFTARFYIPEELRYRAEIRFDRKGSGWLPVILISVGVVLAAAAICWFLPDVLQFADNLIGVFSPD